MKDNKKLKIYISLFVVVLIIIGVSYAYFMLRKEQTNDNVIGTRTCLNTTLNEQTSRILLEDAIPISDNDGINQTPFTFSVTNNCDSYVKLTITIENENRESTSTSLLNDNLIKINLSPKGTTTGTSKLLGILTLTDIEAGRKGYIISETGLKGGETKEYDLRTWMDSNTTLDEGLGKSWEGKIVIIVDAEEEPKALTELILGKNNANVTTPLTTPGLEVSPADEAVLASTADDYGTSYYYRGAVENNYVEYANMCWRIVRITGDGSIKLVLYYHNELSDTNNTPASTTPCSAKPEKSAQAALVRFEGDTQATKYNTGYNENAYAGLMYGDPSATTYAETHANINKSTILTNLEKWYDNVFMKQSGVDEDQLADTILCNDKSIVTDSTFNPKSLTLGTNYGVGNNINYYGTAKRLINSTSDIAGGTGPTLVCPNDNLGGKLSKLTVNDTEYGNGALDKKVGILTADEVMFAGMTYKATSNNSYLGPNANYELWTSSPAYMMKVSDSGIVTELQYIMLVQNVTGFVQNFFVARGITTNAGIRPTISLKNNVTALGNGTKTNPYKLIFE